ncbi:MAG: choice-of-anchor I family protein [Treponemataceae bacterium]
MKGLKTLLSFCLIACTLVSCASTKSSPKGSQSDASSVKLHYVGSYNTNNYDSSADGGVAEIVDFNLDKNYMYIVSGHKQELLIVEIKANGSTVEKQRIKLSTILSDKAVAGDMTSVAYNPLDKTVAVAVQHTDYTANGKILILSDEGKLQKTYNAGVQPDMVVFSPDGKYVATANEGEPRKGYVDGIDPEGSITLVELSSNTVTTTNFAGVNCDKKVLIKAGATAQKDLEPEYIAFSDDSKALYVSLQENNAIASLDIKTKKWNYIKGLGFKDHSLEKNAIDLTRLEAKDVEAGKGNYIDIKPEPNVFGVYMPDGIAYVEIAGKGYILTANEGDAREWDGSKKENNYSNVDSGYVNKSSKVGKKTEFLIPSSTSGLEEGKTYLLGGRSFSIWSADDLHLVYDSGSDFEKITAAKFPKYFNSDHSEVSVDKRSSKKGPEPETVATIKIDEKFYALIALERIGGIFLYDISNPAEATFVDYYNPRNFEASDIKQQGDLGPEGIATITAEKSPTGKPLVLVANEISGTVSIFEIK